MRTLTTAALLAVFATGCGANHNAFIGCQSDDECGGEQVCFIDGCGDPGKNIVVEVVPNPKNGLYAQDLQVGELRSHQDLELKDPSSLQGEVRVEGTSSSSTYSGTITLRLTGESLLIPGVTRRHEATLTPDDGAYTLPVGSGRYNVTLLPANPELPPLSSSRDVQPGQSVKLDFSLPDASTLIHLSGKVLRAPLVLVDAELEAQALDAELHPLSQRVPVDRGSGSFTLALPPWAAQLSTVLIQVTPTSADALVPQKTFTVSPLQTSLDTLYLGDYGLPVLLGGQVLGQDGRPVPLATVYLQGKVGGGGQFRSQKVTTDTNGLFTLLTLPSASDSNLTIYAVPPPGSHAGLTLKSLAVPQSGITLAPKVVCGERLKVEGTLQLPSDSKPAAGVRVVAEPIGEVTGWPRPSTITEATLPSDDTGHFELALDPGQYRFDFMPTDGLPRVSRIVMVRPVDGTSDTSEPLELSTFTLSKGRRVTGTVGFSGERLTQPAAPYASIRFFRVVNVEGTPTALLLAQTLSDQSGVYSATLPTR